MMFLSSMVQKERFGNLLIILKNGKKKIILILEVFTIFGFVIALLLLFSRMKNSTPTRKLESRQLNSIFIFALLFHSGIFIFYYLFSFFISILSGCEGSVDEEVSEEFV